MDERALRKQRALIIEAYVTDLITDGEYDEMMEEQKLGLAMPLPGSVETPLACV